MVIKLENFPNLLDSVTFDSDGVINQIKTFELVFLKNKNYQVEWNMKIPIFACKIGATVVKAILCHPDIIKNSGRDIYLTDHQAVNDLDL